MQFLATCSVRIHLAGVGSKERLRDVAPWVKCPRPAPSTEWQCAHDDAPCAVMHAHRQDFHETFQKVALTDVDHGYITLGISWQNQQNACPMHKCRFMCAQFNCHFSLSDIQNDPNCCRLRWLSHCHSQPFVTGPDWHHCESCSLMHEAPPTLTMLGATTEKYLCPSIHQIQILWQPQNDENNINLRQ